MKDKVNEPPQAAAETREDNRRHNRSDPAYVGVGLNRIRISPVPEVRPAGSMAERVVQSLLRRYSAFEKAMYSSVTSVDDKLDDAEESSQSSEVWQGVDNRTNPSKKNGRQSINPIQPDDSKLDKEKRPGVSCESKLVHEYNLPATQMYRQAKPTQMQILRPILLDSGSRKLPKALEHLPQNFKVNILDRKTGRVLSGAKAVAVRDLPAVLRQNASFEPLIPPPGLDLK